MANPGFGGDDLPPLSRSFCGEEVSSLLEHGKDELRSFGEQHHLVPDVVQDSKVQELVEVFQRLEISTQLERHRLRAERQEQAGQDVPHDTEDVYCKNLLVKDKRGAANLIICHEDDMADLKVVKYHLQAHGNLHFASRESLWNMLGVVPEAVTPLALIRPSNRGVNIHMDASLMERIDRDVTRLYFHPLRPDLQVALTLADLERFLYHCGVALHRLPSLTRYSAGRCFNLQGAGEGGEGRDSVGYWQRKQLKTSYTHGQGSPQENMGDSSPLLQEEDYMEVQVTDDDDTKKENSDDKKTGSDTAEGGATGGPVEEAIRPATEYVGSKSSGTFEWQSLKSDILALVLHAEVISATDQATTSSTPIPCKSVFLKDKRDNHFLFVCHNLQKVDFSNLKMHLRPRKKITPLDAEELWSLCHMQEGFESPFYLSRFKQPRFLVAIADNLQTLYQPQLTFPHPRDVSLRVRIPLHDLEVFVRQTQHNLVFIPVKGTVQFLEASRATCTVTSFHKKPQSASLQTAALQTGPVADTSDRVHGHLDREDSSLHDDEDGEQDSNGLKQFHRPERNRELFLWMTALRRQIRNTILWLVDKFYRFVPARFLALLPGSSVAIQWIQATSDVGHAAGNSCQADKEPGEEKGRGNRETKLTRLRHLSQIANINVELTELEDQTKSPPNVDEAESCKMALLLDKYGAPTSSFVQRNFTRRSRAI